MNEEAQDRAEELLRSLGLKTYEARSFIALCRIPHGTAKDISELADVPRTRVYDAMESLEERGLVEIQHGSPQRFRAIPIEEAIETLRQLYEGRIDDLDRNLRELEPAAGPDEDIQQVWALTGDERIDNRKRELVASAREEVIYLVEEVTPHDSSLADTINDAIERGVDVVLRIPSDIDAEVVESTVDGATVISDGLECLEGDVTDAHESLLGILLVDRGTVLLTYEGGEGRERGQRAIWAKGAENGLVRLTARLLSKHLENCM